MGFYTYTKRINSKLMPVFAALDTTNYVPTSSDVGSLVLGSSGFGHSFSSTSLPDLAPALIMGILSIAEATTHGSTTPYYVEQLVSGEAIVADFSTTYAGSTADYVTSTNIGKFFRTCLTTGSTTFGTIALQAQRAKFIDPSTAVNVMASTNGHIFKMVGYSTSERKGVFVFRNSTTLAI